MNSWLLFFAMLLPVEQPDTLVVCPDAFTNTIQEWVDYRTTQGHVIQVIPSPKTAGELRTQIRELAKANSKLKTVLLVGDSKGLFGTTPTSYVNANVNVLYGAQPKIATDNRFVDMDDDNSPDLSIGRMPVDTPEELSAMIKRVIAYEKNNSGRWLKRINFVAGVGGFGQLIDKLIEQSAKQMITDLVPAGYSTSMTYGSWNSPYCPDPRRFSETSIERFNEGCLFWVYIGHGATHRLDSVRLPDRSYDILDNSTVGNLDSAEGNPIAIFLACSTGGFDDPQDCLAENMLRQESGPIAVLASTRVAMPYGLSTFTLEMTREHFGGDVETLGEVVMLAKQRLIKTEDPSELRQMIEAMGKGFAPNPELLDAERLEHADLMHLLGDPLLRIKRGAKLDLNASVSKEDDKVVVTGVAPFAGDIQLALSYKRDRFRFRPARRPNYEPAKFAEYQEAYEKAKDLTCLAVEEKVSQGEFRIVLQIPEGANGECVVQGLLLQTGGFAIDSSSVDLGARK
jgi:hypothetical protein